MIPESKDKASVASAMLQFSLATFSLAKVVVATFVCIVSFNQSSFADSVFFDYELRQFFERAKGRACQEACEFRYMTGQYRLSRLLVSEAANGILVMHAESLNGCGSAGCRSMVWLQRRDGIEVIADGFLTMDFALTAARNFLAGPKFAALIVGAKPSWPRNVDSDPAARLYAALIHMHETLAYKLELDVGTVALALWNVHEIEAARRPADLLGAPLAAVQEWISISSSARAALSMFRHGQEAASLLQTAAALIGLQQLQNAGGDFVAGLVGPGYVDGIRSLYRVAGEVPDNEAFEGIFRQQVMYGRDSGLTVRVVPPKLAFDRGAPRQLVTLKNIPWSYADGWGALWLAASKQTGWSDRLSSALERFEELRLAIERSTLMAVTVEIESAPLVTDKITFGAIAEKRRLHSQLLRAYAEDLGREKIKVTVSLIKSVGALALATLEINFGAKPTVIQSSILAVDELAFTALTSAFTTDTRRLVTDVPQDMILSLSTEARTAWLVAETGLIELGKELGLPTLVPTGR